MYNKVASCSSGRWFHGKRGKIWCANGFSTVAILGNWYFDVGKYLIFDTIAFPQKNVDEKYTDVPLPDH